MPSPMYTTFYAQLIEKNVTEKRNCGGIDELTTNQRESAGE